ncbi:S9 family peptidase [Sphingobacterium bovistauri]|uniref:DPP IV N-terminal domain-containing protein n=1 Tax=Sphingobacterium bovistauri TaxID=2781959 RepID=A0ABS7Z6L7_9SPHI|nr:DPP IV N-terminal domain-containing protein [Sphingobacterium bovistauri]MCA5005828.1 DPP IV N-terminal domain-containing protein [Sphingobacterium bovistauri]
MKKLLLFFLLSSSTAYAQRNFIIDETVFGPSKFAPKTIFGMQWTKNTDQFTHLDATYQNLVSRNAKDKWSENVIANTKDLKSALEKVIIDDKYSLKSFPYNYEWLDEDNIKFQIAGEKNRFDISYNIKAKSAKILKTLPSGLENTEESTHTAYLIGNNIEILTTAGEKIQVTKDTVDGIVNGSSNTHRQEFGIHKGMWWSPNGKNLLYYRKDETMVTKYPLPQWDTRIATIKNTRYPMAGMKSEEVTLIVFNTETKSYTTLKTAEPKEQYLTSVTWDPSNEFVYAGVLNRGQDHLKLNQYNAHTGDFVKTLFEEKSKTWVEPQHELTFLPNNTTQFLYQTDKEGYNQLYLYNTNGKLIKHLGYNDIIVEDFKGFNSNGTKAYYVGVTNKGLERHLYAVELKSGKTTQLTKTNGVHNATISPNGNYTLDQFSNLTTPYKVQIINNKDGQTKSIFEASNPFEGQINMPKIEFKEFISPDSKTPLNARITYPINFDSSKKYPVMVYLYGGSHAQMITDRWLGGVGYFDLYMAQNGYIVFTLDNRGSDARGRDFTRVTHRQLGEAEIADQLVGFDYLKSLPYVDKENMGIFGWSYGGFMTTSLMTKHNSTFKAGVAGGPVMDWKYYEVMYGERYMDTPQENPEGYKKTSLLDKADRLKGNLLIIHGAQDPVVVQQHSMDFVEQCIKNGIQVDYFLYPTHEHNVRGKDRIHMYDKIAKYFDIHLKK